MKKPSRADEKTALILCLRRITEQLGTRSLSRAEFLRRSGVSDRKLRRLFGRYNQLAEAAGVIPMGFGGNGGHYYSPEEITAEIARVLRLPNAKVTANFFKRCSRISLGVCARRFGSWFNALKATAATLDPARDAELLSRIGAYTAGHEAISEAAAPDTGDTQPAARDDSRLPASDGEMVDDYSVLYGDFIHFRGVEHAPINEQGVILLFGMICRDLGYVIEIMRTGFPDCVAKRQLRPGVWERVRIEFEFRSRTFCTHRHDPQQCDVIVCWEHNWPDCPIEVHELKSLLRRLSA